MNGNLPKGFRSWTQIYLQLQEHGLLKEKFAYVEPGIMLASYANVSIETIKISVDEVKEKRLEEALQLNTLTNNDIDLLLRVLFESPRFTTMPGNALVDKLKKMLRLRYDFGFYE
jgi:hypothetical protein